MFKNILPRLWAFDLEWVPDAESGRRVYNLPDSASDEEVIFEMWKQGGATDEDPQPYLKTVLCRVVSVAAVCRSVQNGEIVLEIKSLPKFGEEPYSEEKLIENFLVSVGKQKPQLVGYNSSEADLPILVQGESPREFP